MTLHQETGIRTMETNQKQLYLFLALTSLACIGLSTLFASHGMGGRKVKAQGGRRTPADQRSVERIALETGIFHELSFKEKILLLVFGKRALFWGDDPLDTRRGSPEGDHTLGGHRPQD